MKKLTILFLSIMASISILAGCGKNPDGTAITPGTTNTPNEVINANDIFGPSQTDTANQGGDSTVAEDNLPAGYVRSSLTNEPVTENVYLHRPIAIMVPMDKVAQPQYNISKAGIVYECLVEGSITRTMCVIEDWQELEKIGNVRSARDYFIYWMFEWDAILLHDGGPFYINELIAQSTTDNISGRGFRDSSRNAPHNEYYSADIVNQYIEINNYTPWHRTEIWDEHHFNFAANGGQTDLTANYSNAVEVYTVDLSNCYPVTDSTFKYDPDKNLYYRYIYGEPHMDAATNQQLAFSNIILQNTYGESRDAKDYRIYQCHDTSRDGWFITNGHAIHVTWEKTTDYGATRYYDDNGNEIELSTGKTMICILQDGGSASIDAIFLDSQGNASHPNS
ncbi:MAG: DUF3048 domain-containing protein [Lachnospiraceae bacterium]|nr:DUF3048 domain-containing protein [Lachnospiraceae bacterium]